MCGCGYLEAKLHFLSSPPLSVQHEDWDATVLWLSVRTSGNTCALWCMECSVVAAGRGEVRRVALQCLRPHPFSAAGYSPRRSLAWAPGGTSHRIRTPGKNRQGRQPGLSAASCWFVSLPHSAASARSWWQSAVSRQDRALGAPLLPSHCPNSHRPPAAFQRLHLTGGGGALEVTGALGGNEEAHPIMHGLHPCPLRTHSHPQGGPRPHADESISFGLSSG